MSRYSNSAAVLLFISFILLLFRQWAAAASL